MQLSLHELSSLLSSSALLNFIKGCRGVTPGLHLLGGIVNRVQLNHRRQLEFCQVVLRRLGSVENKCAAPLGMSALLCVQVHSNKLNIINYYLILVPILRHSFLFSSSDMIWCQIMPACFPCENLVVCLHASCQRMLQTVQQEVPFTVQEQVLEEAIGSGHGEDCQVGQSCLWLFWYVWLS
jgi:hypothetical protein